MNPKNIIKGAILSLGLITLQSCDKDFSQTGSEIIGGGDYAVETLDIQDIKAYNISYGAVEATRLPEISLGALKNGDFGAVENSIVLNFGQQNAAFSKINETAVIDSVYLYMPVAYAKVKKKEDDITTYELPFTYGTGSFDLKVYQNGYLLTNDNPVSGGFNSYYSDNNSLFDLNLASEKLNNDFSHEQNTNVIFNEIGKNIFEKDEEGNIKYDDKGNPIVKSVIPPSLNITLDLPYFQKLFVGKRQELANNFIFEDILRGLYLKASVNSTTGTISLIDVPNSYLRATYSQKITTTDKEGVETTKDERGEIKLSFITSSSASGTVATSTNIVVNLMNNTQDQSFISNIEKSNPATGDSHLFLKGGDGSVSIIEILKENDNALLKELRENKILINDAFITIHVDKEEMKDKINPKRLFLYNFDDSTIIADYTNDSSTNKEGYGGLFINEDVENDKEGYTYTFRIKDHIINLLKAKDVRNPKLGLVVFDDLTFIAYQSAFKSLKTPIENEPRIVKGIPTGAVTTPLATKVYGTHNVTDDKKMKLEIFYTKIKK